MRKAILSIIILLHVSLAAVHAQYPNYDWHFESKGDSSEYGLDLTLDNSGNIITIGVFEDTVDFNPGPDVYQLSDNSGGFGFFIQKLDSTGGFIWAKALLGSPFSLSPFSFSPFAVAIDSNNNIIIISNSYNTDSFIVKLDSNGDYIWAKSFNGSGTIRPRALHIDSSDNIILGGNYSGNPDFDFGPDSMYTGSHEGHDIFLQKLDSDGNFIWVKTMTGSGNGSSYTDRIESIITDSSDNIYVSGDFSKTDVDFDPGPGFHYMSATVWSDIFVQKLDSDGNFLWAFQLAGWQEDRSLLTLDNNENLIICGEFGSTADFDPGPGVFNMTSTSIHSNRDFFFLKVDSSGSFIWAKSIEKADQFNFMTAVKTDSENNVYTTASFQRGIDFDPGPEVHWIAPTSGGKNTYILKLDSLGNFIWQTAFGGTNHPYSMDIDNSGNIYITGTINQTSDFDPSPTNSTNEMVNGDWDFYLVKLNQNATVSVPDNDFENSFFLYPNPTSSQVSFDSGSEVVIEVVIYDIAGKFIKSTNPETNVISLSELTPGTYIIKFIGNERTVTKKIIKK